MRQKLIYFICIIILFFNLNLLADEGMWTFDNPPKKLVKEKYGFDLSDKWLEHVRLSCVRFTLGGSGSFVSGDGLVMTNHHVSVGMIEQVSTKEHDYVKDGFYAKRNQDEIKLSGGECNVLIDMTNITGRIKSVLKDGMNVKETTDAKKDEFAKIKKEFKTNDTVRYDIVTLYNGGEYWLYKYKKYTDLRLVFAPEGQMAHYGGEYDNFCFPRWCLDVSFVRIYENDQPLKTPDYLKWNTKGASENELIFVTGHPGTTERLKTYAELEYIRDFSLPNSIKASEAKINSLKAYSKLGKGEERNAVLQIQGISNGYKATIGRYQGLLDPRIMQEKKKEDDALRAAIMNNPKFNEKYGKAWEDINTIVLQAKSLQKLAFWYPQIMYGMVSSGITIYRYAEQVQKQEIDRLDGYKESDLEHIKKQILRKSEYHKDMEIAVFETVLTILQKELGNDDILIRTALKGKTPKERAIELLANTKLDNIEFRKKLLEKPEEVINSDEPLIIFAKEISELIRGVEKPFKESVNNGLDDANEKIADARFVVYGKNTYPDATFSLRISYGTTKGFPYNGTISPYKTTLYGLFDRAESFENKDEFEITKVFLSHKKDLELSTPVNLVSTTDIIGGNSGSPAINKNAEVIGLVFDGNIESLPGRYIYDMERNRTVCVHPAYIIEALRKVYDANRLADELEK